MSTFETRYFCEVCRMRWFEYFPNNAGAFFKNAVTGAGDPKCRGQQRRNRARSCGPPRDDVGLQRRADDIARGIDEVKLRAALLCWVKGELT